MILHAVMFYLFAAVTVAAGVIVASGLYIGHRERIRHRLSQQQSPPQR